MGLKGFLPINHISSGSSQQFIQFNKLLRQKPALMWILVPHVPFFDGARHLSSNYNSQQNKTCSLPWKFWIWKEKRERDQHPGAFIILTIDMSDHRLHQHAIQISSHWHLWYSSRHYSFVVPQVCHATAAHTHTHTHGSHISVSCWNGYWCLKYDGTENMWGWDHLRHKTEKPVPAGIRVCVFLINIHTARDQQISSGHFLMVAYKGLILIFWPLKQLKMLISYF